MNEKIKIQVCVDNGPPAEIEVNSQPVVGETIVIGNTRYEVLDIVSGKGGTQIQVTPI